MNPFKRISKILSTCQWSQWIKCSSTETEMTRRGSLELSVAAEDFALGCPGASSWFSAEIFRGPLSFSKNSRYKHKSPRTLPRPPSWPESPKENDTGWYFFKKKFFAKCIEPLPILTLFEKNQNSLAQFMLAQFMGRHCIESCLCLW